MNLTKIFVGVDVSKNNLDVFLRPVGQHFRLKNNIEGIEELLNHLSKYTVGRIVCEASGGYESLVTSALSRANYKIWLMEPKRIKSFIASEGIKAKTDKIDARMLALFAEQKELPEEMCVKTATTNEELLQALVKRREVIVKMVAQEKTRLDHPQSILCKDDIESLIAHLANKIENIDEKIQNIINGDSKMLDKQKIITSIPGAGKVLSATLIATMPELGKIENKSIAALIGVVPYTNESGNFKKQATIREGRPIPRKALYMPTLSAIRCNQDFKKFYNRLLSNGKKPKVAIVAVMRKFIIVANTLVAENRMWEPNKNANLA